MGFADGREELIVSGPILTVEIEVDLPRDFKGAERVERGDATELSDNARGRGGERKAIVASGGDHGACDGGERGVAKDVDAGDEWRGGEELLESRGGDEESLGDLEERGLAVDDGDGSVGAQLSDVAGAEEALAREGDEGVVGLLLVAVVSLRQFGGVREDLSAGMRTVAGGETHLGAVEEHHCDASAQLSAGREPPDFGGSVSVDDDRGEHGKHELAELRRRFGAPDDGKTAAVANRLHLSLPKAFGLRIGERAEQKLVFGAQGLPERRGGAEDRGTHHPQIVAEMLDAAEA